MKTSAVVFILIALNLGVTAHAQTARATAAKPGNHLVFAVSEGTSGGIDPTEAVQKYRPLADVLAAAADVPVTVTLVRSFEALEAGMKAGTYDLVMARPSDYPGRGVRDYGYSLVATAKPDGQSVFIVNEDSPLKSLVDTKGKVVMLPEKVSYMAKFCTAELRDHGIDLSTANVTYTREQGGVGAAVETHMVDVGCVASYSGVARNWEKKGHRILHRSAPRPYFPLIANKRVPAGKLARMQKALASLPGTDAGRNVLNTIGVQAFNTDDAPRLMELLAWIEPPKAGQAKLTRK